MSPQPVRQVREPAVAGMFYPGDSPTLARTVSRLLDAAPEHTGRPKALIVPHAGYIYSGAVAAHAYAMLRALRTSVTRVVLLGPSHRVALRGMAVPSVDAFRTPLGPVPLDRAAIELAATCPQVSVHDAPHAADHALEVQLPFLQAQLDEFALVPIAVGECAPEAIARVLDLLWGGLETLIVVSSDLSHFHPYAKAVAIDEETCCAILEHSTALSPHQACGCHGINGMLRSAAQRHMSVELLERKNSGDVTGDRNRVVGYASFALHES